MKRLIFIILTGLFSHFLFAQDSLDIQQKTFRTEWAYGLNGGLTLSKISFNPIVPQNFLMQVVGGVTVRYISEKNVGLQVELNYSLRGWKERIESNNTVPNTNPAQTQDPPPTGKYSRSIAYLELPILTHFYINTGKRGRIIFNVGPQLGYCLSEKIIESQLYTTYPKPFLNYYDTKVQRVFDWGLTGGLGFELRTGIGSFLIDGRYYFGLSDIFSNHKTDYFSSSSNQVISLKVAYLLRKQ